MWKAKKRNVLLAFQLFIGFLVIFVLITLATHNIQKYIQPLGFHYQDRWLIQFSSVNKDKIKQIYNQLASKHGITISSVSSGAPYFPGYGSSKQSSRITGKEYINEYIDVDLAYNDVMGLSMAEGRWFNESDLMEEEAPVVITSAFKEAYLGNTEVNNSDYFGSKIVGVLKNFRKYGEFDGETSSAIKIIKPEDGDSFILKVPKDSGMELEEQLVNSIRSIAPTIWLKITHLEDQRAEYLQKKLTPLLVIAGIGIFLFINVILGLFGVLWYSISQRTSEIGLRRAVGATAANISIQFVAEMLILASMGIIPGMVVAAQIQILNLLKTNPEVYLLSLALTTMLIYALVSLSALIPGIKSVKLKPAEALADE